MKKLIDQIIKFGVVGALCFVIDFVITMIVSKILRDGIGMTTSQAAVVGAFFGFTVSVVVNYLLSMKFVFVRREDMDRKKEFVIFVILSVIGLGIHEVVILLCTNLILGSMAGLTALVNNNQDVITAAAKMVATAVVMIYNFISRKIFLEQK